MRILLDECVHRGVRKAFTGHAVTAVTDTQWRGSEDGPLLRFAERNFDVFVTIDQALARAVQPEKLKLRIVLVRVPNNKLSSYLPLFSELKRAAESAEPGQVLSVGRAGH